MKKYIKIIMLASIFALLNACETVPEKSAAPKSTVSAADAASAIMAADIAISNAKQRGNLWRDTSKTLDKADNAMAADEYGEAQKLANKARVQAEDAVIQSYHGDAEFLINSLSSDHMDEMSAGQKAQLESAKAALDEGQTQAAYDMATSIKSDMDSGKSTMDEAPMMANETSPEMAPEMTSAKSNAAPMPVTPSAQGSTASYTVKANDNLWSIAAMSEVYGNVDMWPLIWKANMEKIKLPDAIEVGMKLNIDRSASSESVAAAIKHSKLRGAPSLGPVDAFDQTYLGK